MTRMALAIPIASIGLLALASCGLQSTRRSDGEPRVHASTPATLAQVYYWKARPGMLEQYNEYITKVAEPIDSVAKAQDAFVSVTTFVSGDTLSPWTHMRVFLLRDSVQVRGLSAALDAAGQRLEPDSVKRRVRGEYSATLRDRVGAALLTVLH
jgi:hypothetical protein